MAMLPELGFMRSGAISSEDLMAQWFSVLPLRYSTLTPFGPHSKGPSTKLFSVLPHPNPEYS